MWLARFLHLLLRFRTNRHANVLLFKISLVFSSPCVEDQRPLRPRYLSFYPPPVNGLEFRSLLKDNEIWSLFLSGKEEQKCFAFPGIVPPPFFLIFPSSVMSKDPLSLLLLRRFSSQQDRIRIVPFAGRKIIMAPYFCPFPF